MKITHRRRGLVQTDRAQQEGGYVLVKFALLLVPLLLMTGLSVDVGSWYSRIADIQKAADAAALAGVVWLPDEQAATRYAREEATRNGFTDGVDNISVDIERAGDRRLRVTISDSTVESFFWSNLGGGDIDLTRSALAEYVLPVPLGSPRNYFGTGTLLDGDAREFLFQSVNPACTSKINGDRHQSLHFNPLNNNRNALTRCDTTQSNGEYRARGYELYIEAPEGRNANIDVLLFDPRYDATTTYSGGPVCEDNITYSPATSWTESTLSSDVTITGPAEYQTRTGTSSWNTWSATQTLTWPATYTRARNLIRYRTGSMIWTPSATSWTTGSGGSSITITGPAQYQTRTAISGTGATWSTTTTNLARGATYTRTANLLRYRTGTEAATTTCTDPPVDSYLGGTGEENFTFSLRSENGTPLTDDDDLPVPGCTKTYSRSSGFDLTFLASRRWNKLCTITPSMTSGRYVLRVTNDGANSRLGDDGSNQWGLVAKYANATGNGLCDGRQTPLCPRVYGRDAISVYANSTGATASFFLAEIEPEHTGKTLELELWDPGEGGQSIRFLKPTGSNSWDAVKVTWSSYEESGADAGHSTGEVTSIALRNGTTDLFNGRLLRIQIPLTGYAPPADNRWWKIEYTFASDRGVTDRTTWSARVIGDPVHLLEEEAD